MEFNETYRERIDSALERVEDAAADGRTLSRSERIEHVTALLGLVHFFDSVERDLLAAPSEWAPMRAEVGGAMTVLTERIRILAEHL